MVTLIHDDGVTGLTIFGYHFIPRYIDFFFTNILLAHVHIHIISCDETSIIKVFMHAVIYLSLPLLCICTFLTLVNPVTSNNSVSSKMK